MESLGKTGMPNAHLDLAATALPLQPHALGSRSPEAVATGFESMFLSLLLKEMRQTLEPGGLFAQDDGDVLGGMFDMFMSQHLAQGGGLGVGAMVRQQLEKAHH